MKNTIFLIWRICLNFDYFQFARMDYIINEKGSIEITPKAFRWERARCPQWLDRPLQRDQDKQSRHITSNYPRGVRRHHIGNYWRIQKARLQGGLVDVEEKPSSSAGSCFVARGLQFSPCQGRLCISHQLVARGLWIENAGIRKSLRGSGRTCLR